MELKFYKCKVCGNIITFVDYKQPKIVCCGQEMEEIKVGVVDASKEKHVPVVTVNSNIVTVSVGSVAHPMVEEHFIEWIALLTKKGVQLKKLTPSDKPEVSFSLTNDDEVIYAYAYCNIHGLWRNSND